MKIDNRIHHIENSDLLDLEVLKEHGIKSIVHCANCCNTFGSGIALAIKNKFPRAYDADTEHYNYIKAKLNSCNSDFQKRSGLFYTTHHAKSPIPSLLGDFSVYEEDTVNIFNLYGQLGCGQHQHYRNVNYEAIASGIQRIYGYINVFNKGNIGVPKNMGSALAGGDWNVVEAILRSELARSEFEGDLYVVSQ